MNLKGGSGKTTLALTLAYGLAKGAFRGRRVLLVDADPQANSTFTMLQGKFASDATLADVLLGELGAGEVIRSTRVPGLDLLPSASLLADCTVLMVDQIGRELRLKTALSSIADKYDVCVIDAPPEMSLIAVNVMTAAENLIVPVDPGVYSASGIGRLQEAVELVRKHLNHSELSVAGLVLTKLTPTNAARDFERQLREHYGALVCTTTIPFSVTIEEAVARHQTVLEYAPSSPVAIAFDALVKELTHGWRKNESARRPHGRNRRKNRARRRAG
jgi:chromosome partitioning protein